MPTKKRLIALLSTALPFLTFTTNPCAFAAGQARSTPPSPAPSIQASPTPSPTPSPTQSEHVTTPPSIPSPTSSRLPPTVRAHTQIQTSDNSLSTLPKILFEIEKKYAASATISARFSQIDHNPTLDKNKTSSGKIFVKKPGKIRWDTETPDPNLLVSNGKIFWFYTPPFDLGENGQLIERRSSEVQSQVATALLSGEFSKVPGIQVKQKSDSTFLITPKSGTAGSVIRAEVTLDLSKNLIQKVALDHRGGNRSEISLSQIELGKPLPDDFFIFKAPPNTDRVK